MKEIDKIIEKYLEGESSLEEEKQLIEFLRQDDIGREYLYLQDQFAYYEDASIEKCMLNTDELQIIEESPVKVHKLTDMQKYLIKISGAAATLLILIGAFFMFVVENDKYPNDTIKDPNLAYNEVKVAFSLISEKMNKGTNKLSNFKLLKTSIEKAGRVSEFNKNLIKAKRLNKFNKYKSKYVSQVFGV